MAPILILGLGNIILRDEGLGVRTVERLLERYTLSTEVEALDGGTLGLHLLPYLEGVRDLLIIDAIRADEPPGSLIRLEGAAIPAALAHKMSMHQFGLSELLAVGSLQGELPQRMVLWGLVPTVMEPGLDLTEPVAASLDPLIERIVAELAAWGVTLTPRLA
ncbi:HyaD/HybD family hydrogenase maturation endopeptidase [Candidatus Chloroploca sp. Khr17]|uniref:HyaD/HybD family hydrogenase maturation endopeptidase n=1 Tax=Candidatus Chloroploca sp. Khr17 TaxID=2496869 RepID=UPI00101B6894|nr:HyaD/HybD family hydrogenase maturation endopeptidase [Candidatus Chloroploca sp. Khr17]